MHGQKASSNTSITLPAPGGPWHGVPPRAGGTRAGGTETSRRKGRGSLAGARKRNREQWEHSREEAGSVGSGRRGSALLYHPWGASSPSPPPAHLRAVRGELVTPLHLRSKKKSHFSVTLKAIHGKTGNTGGTDVMETRLYHMHRPLIICLGSLCFLMRPKPMEVFGG